MKVAGLKPVFCLDVSLAFSTPSPSALPLFPRSVSAVCGSLDCLCELKIHLEKDPSVNCSYVSSGQERPDAGPPPGNAQCPEIAPRRQLEFPCRTRDLCHPGEATIMSLVSTKFLCPEINT